MVFLTPGFHVVQDGFRMMDGYHGTFGDDIELWSVTTVPISRIVSFAGSSPGHLQVQPNQRVVLRFH